MASLKKAKGKARRAAKAKDQGQVTRGQEIGGHPPQRNDALMNNGDTTRCNHGLDSSHCNQQSRGTSTNKLQVCKWFLQAFVHEFDGAAGDFIAAYHATKEKCAIVWNDADMMEFVVSFLLACGTGKTMERNIKIACKYAALASYFQQYLEVEFLHTRAFPNWPKIRELYAADEHTLISFLKKRIPCSCLDEKYEEIKSMPKIGICCSSDCPLPCGKTERSATMCCSSCRAANYCSRECQVAAWKEHKGECGFYTELKAKFKKTKQQQEE